MEADRLKALASLNEPSRRRVYNLVAQAGEASRENAAEMLGIARSVAAFHLDKLVEAGLLEVSHRRPPGRSGPGAGRPAKWYRRTGEDLTVSVPDRRYELAAKLLAAAVDQAVTRSQPVTQALRQVSRQYGRHLGASLPVEDGPPTAQAVMTLLAEQGYEPRLHNRTILLGNCPFRSLAGEHRQLVCTMNLDLLRGLTQAAKLPATTARLDPRPGCCCVTLGGVAAWSDAPSSTREGGVERGSSRR